MLAEEEMPAASGRSRSEGDMDDDGFVSLCAIHMDGEMFGIETVLVREVLGRAQALNGTGPVAGKRPDLRVVPLAPRYIAGLIPYRGEVLTTLSFRALLGRGPETVNGSVLVLDDEESGEQLGLMVDEVSGVVTVQKTMLEPNPYTLDSRSKALFDGVYKTPLSLIVRIDPRRLRPARLAAVKLFDEPADPDDTNLRGDTPCAR